MKYRLFKTNQSGFERNHLKVKTPRFLGVYCSSYLCDELKERWDQFEFDFWLPMESTKDGKDFLIDWVVGANQEKVRIINIMDEGSSKALWTEAHTSISAKTLTSVLDKIVQWRDCPRYIRCDNGPEFISDKLAQWALTNNIEIRFIQHGKPTQNGLIERLNGTL